MSDVSSRNHSPVIHINKINSLKWQLIFIQIKPALNCFPAGGSLRNIGPKLSCTLTRIFFRPNRQRYVLSFHARQVATCRSGSVYCNWKRTAHAHTVLNERWMSACTFNKIVWVELFVAYCMCHESYYFSSLPPSFRLAWNLERSNKYPLNTYNFLICGTGNVSMEIAIHLQTLELFVFQQIQSIEQ